MAGFPWIIDNVDTTFVGHTFEVQGYGLLPMAANEALIGQRCCVVNTLYAEPDVQTQFWGSAQFYIIVTDDAQTYLAKPLQLMEG